MYCGLFWSCDCHSTRVGLKLYFAVGERCWLQEQVVFLSLTPPPKSQSLAHVGQVFRVQAALLLPLVLVSRLCPDL